MESLMPVAVSRPYPTRTESNSTTPRQDSWDVRAAICALRSKDLTEYTDESLMFLLRNAVDRHTVNELFSELFRRHRLRVRNWCGQFTRQHDAVPDLVQEVFMRAFRRLDTYQGNSRFSTWLYVITRNHCLNVIKKRTSEPSEESKAITSDFPGADGRDIHEALEKDQFFREMWSLIHATLTPTEVRVMSLHFGHGLPIATVTRELMLSNPSGAKAYIVSARRKLKVALQSKESKVVGSERLRGGQRSCA